MWWMVDVCFSHVLNEENLTHAQEKCLDLGLQATNIMSRSLHDCIFREIMDIKTAHKIWSYLNEKNGAASDDDNELKEEVHEDVEHIHNMVIVEDCSTSWSSNDDDQSTTSSLDKVDDVDSSVTSDDSTPSTLDDQVDIKVSNCNVIDLNSYDELLSRYASLTKCNTLI